ncbi:flavin reductase [Ensifer sp. ENS06]|uniref:LysR substrate-binding domain-containing protein n=1 Tax=Ensifer sp. ENS06 TaxID=2769276 RepID=UPI001781EEA2|nr:LysR substrate-binding domain-containing protein [Ensifer sp. ENS06]MBD9628148.1 flavin reductase [Ensifer sp. ENS06]
MDTKIEQTIRLKFLEGMSHAACTVNIVTTDGPAGRAGVTVSAMASVSADSAWPTMLVCVHHLSPAAAKIVENGVLCVNVLRDDQSYISDTFAGRFKEEVSDKFECAEWSPMPSGAPRIIDPLVAFDCRLLTSEKVGTHYMFLCAVRDLHISRSGSPLIYANRAYGASMRIDGARSLAAARANAGSRLSVACFHTFGPFIMPRLIQRMEGIDIRLVEGDQRRLSESLRAGESELALLYDIDLTDDFKKIALDHLSPHVLLPDGHRLASQPEIEATDLAEEPMVLLDAPPSADYFVGVMRAAGVEPLIAYRSMSFEMVRGLVGHGLGYALLVTKPAADMTYDGMKLVARPLVGQQAPSSIVIAHRKEEVLSGPARRFIECCVEVFRNGSSAA